MKTLLDEINPHAIGHSAGVVPSTVVCCRSTRWASILDRTITVDGVAYVHWPMAGDGRNSQLRASVRNFMRNLRDSGVKRLIVLCDGLMRGVRPASLFIVEDHLNLTGDNPLIGAGQREPVNRFLDMSNAYDTRIRDLLLTAARQSGVDAHTGIALDPPYPRGERPGAYPRKDDRATVWGIAFPVTAARQAGLATGAAAWLERSDATNASDEGLEPDGIVRFWASAAGSLADDFGVS